MKELVKYTLGFWMLLFTVSLPFNFSTIPHPGVWITESFYPLAKWLGESIFDLELVAKATTSDAATLYIQMLVLAFAALILAFIARTQSKLSAVQIQLFLHRSCTYILAFFLLKYGFDKLFHFQFYQPEPNTLFTPVGGLTKDILFWSTMGSSSSYNTFMGFIEVLPGLLLLWKRTRLFGALIGLGVLINVFAINVGFDITVKMLSLYLVLLAAFVLYPWYNFLIGIFFTNGKSTEVQELTLNLKPILKRALKGGIIFVFALELLSPYIDQGSFSGIDYGAIPYYGSYQVENQDAAFLGDSTIRRIHIHSKGYFIIESVDGNFKDYSIRISESSRSIKFEDVDLQLFVENRKNLIAFTWSDNGVIKSLETLKLDLDDLPLRDDTAHWTVDGLMNAH